MRKMMNCTSVELKETFLFNCTWNNQTDDDNATKFQRLRQQMNIIQMFVCPTLLVIGLLGNICIVFTVSNVQFRQMTSRFILCALAFSDSLLLCTNPFNQQFMQSVWNGDVRAITKDGCKFFFVMYRLAKTSSSWCVVLIALERFVAVKFPLKAKTILTKRTIALTISCVYLTLLCIHGIWTFSTDIVDGVCTPDVVTENTRKLHKIFVIIGAATYSLVPVSIMLTVTPPIVITLVKRHRLQRTLAQATNRTLHDMSRVSVMLVMIVVFYIVWVTPITLVLIITVWTNQPIFGSQKKEMIIFQGVALIFEQLNHSCNFIIYIMFSTQFRRRFLHMIRCERKCICVKSKTSHSVQMFSIESTPETGSSTNTFRARKTDDWRMTSFEQ